MASTVLFHRLSDAQQLISCGEDGCLQVIDVNTGTEVFSKSAGQDLR